MENPEFLKNLERPKEYALSPGDFAKKPVRIEQFIPGVLITRSHFTPFLIQSFRVSRGYADIQHMFFIWMKERYGFDAIKSIGYFLDEGGWKALSKKEQELFLESFQRVKGHEYLRQHTSDEIETIQRELSQIPSEFNRVLEKEYPQEFFNPSSLATPVL